MGEHGSRAGWLFALPAAVLLLIPPPALGSYAANRLGAVVPRPASTAFPALPTGQVATLKVRDYAERATWGHGGTLQARTVRMSGFVTPHTGGGWYLTRPDAWVEVTGRWAVARVRADRLVAIDRPPNPYE